MPDRDTILGNVRIALFALFAVLLCVEGLALWNGAERSRADDWVRHTLEVENRLDDLLASMVDSETAVRGYALLGMDEVLEPLQRAEENAPALVEAIARLTADNPRQAERMAPLREAVRSKLAFNEQVVAARRSGDPDAARALLLTQRGMHPMRDIRALIHDMTSEEERLLAERTAVAAARARWTTRFSMLVTVLLVLLLLALSRFVRIELLRRQRDAEALRQSEERLRLMVESARENALYMLDTAGHVVSWNSGAERIKGWSEEEILGKSFSRFYVPEDAAAGKPQQDLARALRDGRFFEEAVRVRSDGSRFWAEIFISPIRNAAGALLGYAKVTRDVSARKQAEAELRDFAQRLERSNRELQEFAMVASHDLQEPLRKIQMFGDLLREHSEAALDEESRDFLRRMQNAASRSQGLIHGLLSYARVSSKAQPFTHVELADVVQEVLGDLEARLQETGGQVDVGPLPTLDADSLQMRQLFQNLIGNALKFRRPGQAPRIEVRAASRGPDGERHWTITVSDNGVGFDEKYLGKLFKMFQRLHDRSAYEGAGMGLAICRRIAERHGGTITAHSKPGEGATFVVELPERQLTQTRTGQEATA